MEFGGSLDGAAVLKRRLKIGVTEKLGQVVILDISGPGQHTNPTTTAAADATGVTTEAGTYTTTQGTGSSSANVESETIIATPSTLFKSAISGGTGGNEDVALSITENNAASTAGLVVTDSNLPSDSMVAGWIYALTGANKSMTRVVTTFVSATCADVTVPFDVTIASGDKFLVFGGCPWVGTKIEITTNFQQVTQWFPSATGVNAAIVDIFVDDNDPASPTARMLFAFRDSYLNTESA